MGHLLAALHSGFGYEQSYESIDIHYCCEFTSHDTLRACQWLTPSPGLEHNKTDGLIISSRTLKPCLLVAWDAGLCSCLRFWVVAPKSRRRSCQALSCFHVCVGVLQVAELDGCPRMGPTFGAMFMSGQKAAHCALNSLRRQRAEEGALPVAEKELVSA